MDEKGARALLDQIEAIDQEAISELCSTEWNPEILERMRPAQEHVAQIDRMLRKRVEGGNYREAALAVRDEPPKALAKREPESPSTDEVSDAEKLEILKKIGDPELRRQLAAASTHLSGGSMSCFAAVDSMLVRLKELAAIQSQDEAVQKMCSEQNMCAELLHAIIDDMIRLARQQPISNRIWYTGFLAKRNPQEKWLKEQVECLEIDMQLDFFSNVYVLEKWKKELEFIHKIYDGDELAFESMYAKGRGEISLPIHLIQIFRCSFARNPDEYCRKWPTLLEKVIAMKKWRTARVKYAIKSRDLVNLVEHLSFEELMMLSAEECDELLLYFRNEENLNLFKELTSSERAVFLSTGKFSPSGMLEAKRVTAEVASL